MASRAPRQLDLDLPVKPSQAIRLMGVDEIFDRLRDIEPVDAVEDLRIERKPAGISARALSDYFSIFANTPPDGGIILVGVEDDGSVSGCGSAHQKHLNELERAGDVHCSDAKYEVKTVSILNRKGRRDTILAIRVLYHPSRVIETNEGHAYIRRGESRRRLTDDEKRDLRNSNGQLDLECESVPLTYPDDFKQNAISKFINTIRGRSTHF